ncbi:MAG: hemolysin family protein [Bacilli bacterium]|nr:hemolysin family protein [Bacilli bacterium]
MVWYYWLIIAVCALLSMYFSMADMVYSLADVEKLARVKDKKQKMAKQAIIIANNYESSVSSVLFGNNLVNVVMTSLVTIIAIALAPENQDTSTLVASIILGVFLIIFCEFLPKAIAKRFSFSLSMYLAYPTQFFRYLFFIIVWPISQLFRLIVKLFSKRSKEEDTIDEEVLTEMVDTIEEEGILEEGEAELVRNSIDLGDIQAFEIMTPRVDVFSIEVNDDIKELLKEEDLFKYSRIPVYEDTIDNIVGILPVKELAKELIKNNENIDILSLCYKPIVIPRNHQVLDVLNEFKEKKVHIAVVIDEYGGTEGILTMEDILEEIVGDIFDESDEIEEEYSIEKGGVYIVDGNMNLDDFFELIEYKDEFETDYSTVAGFCQEILDRFAKKDDEFDFSHYHFTILAADEFTVEKLKVVDLEYNESDEEENN